METNRVLERYRSEVVGELMKKFSYKSVMEVPRLLKINLNCGLGEAVQNPKALEFAEYSLTQIAGQKAVVTRAKKSIAAFKLREGMPIGCRVTLRKGRMFDFFDRLVSVGLPRTRDFRGIPKKGFDGKGNYTMGVKESIVFPEVDIDKLDKIRGLEVSFVTTAKTDEEGRALLSLMGLPFRQ